MAEQGPLSGQTVGGKYLLGELLGEGGFGTVYVGQHLLLGRPQAIKFLLERYFRQPKFRERFLREARTAAALDHPHIVHIDDFGMEEEALRAYLVMPFLGGGTFQEILMKAKKQERPLDIERVVFYAEQISSALDYAHQRGVVHLDLKPQNLLVHDDGGLVLADFGLAHLIKREGLKGGSSLGYGTPHYMAPEHIQGHPEKQSDVYALGVMLYQMLVGRRPFEGEGVPVMMMHLTEPPPPLQAWRKDVPLELEGVLERALAKESEHRYQSAGELLEAFTEALKKARNRMRKEAEEWRRKAEEEQAHKEAEEQRRRRLEEEYAEAERRASVEAQYIAEKEGRRRKAEEEQAQQIGTQLEMSPSHPKWLFTSKIAPRTKVLFFLVCIWLAILAVFGVAASRQMAVAAQARLDATATVVAANPDPYPPTQGRLALYDPLSQPDDNWDNNSDSSFGGACQFTQGAYHVSQSQPDATYLCYASSSTDFSNFAFEVQMTITKGDCGGIQFRVDDTKGSSYKFHVCQDGSYALYLYSDYSGKNAKILRSGSSQTIHTGYNHSNAIAVVANGSSLNLYVNNQKIDSANDTTFSHGIIALDATYYNNSTEVIYSNAKAWTL